MSTVTIAQYQVHTGDATTASATVQANLDLAEEFVEEFLRRELASEERTEKMKVYPNGYVYPQQIPVTSVPASADYEVYDTATIRYVNADDITTDVGRWPITLRDSYPHSFPYATVTYTAGWTSATLPASIVRVVCKIAEGFVNPGSINTPGIKQAAVGDVNVTYGANTGDSGQLVDSLYPGASASLSKFRWRPR